MLLLLEAGETHGYKLHHELLVRGIDLQATVLYRWLGKFERDGWVASRWAEPVEGPRRHVYVLTAEGRSMLRATTGSVAATRDTYSTFLDSHTHAVARRHDAADIGEAPAPARAGNTEPAVASSSALPPTPPHVRPHKELLVGWLLLHLDAGATYGYDLRRGFEAHRLSPDRSAMYRMLRRLEADRWVQSRWMQPVAGPRRRFYRLTTSGRRNLDEIARVIEAIRDAHDRYLQAYEHAHDATIATDTRGG